MVIAYFLIVRVKLKTNFKYIYLTDTFNNKILYS